MAQEGAAGKKKQVGKTEKAGNTVAEVQIMTEAIKKEMQFSRLYTNYTVNPFKKLYPLSPKPNAFDEDQDAVEDTHFTELFKRANLEPTRKYLYPQTESQEYGWISKPILEVDRSDTRLNHPRGTTDVTQYMHAFWRMKEQTENMGPGAKSAAKAGAGAAKS